MDSPGRTLCILGARDGLHDGVSIDEQKECFSGFEMQILDLIEGHRSSRWATQFQLRKIRPELEVSRVKTWNMRELPPDWAPPFIRPLQGLTQAVKCWLTLLNGRGVSKQCQLPMASALYK